MSRVKARQCAYLMEHYDSIMHKGNGALKARIGARGASMCTSGCTR